MSYRPLTRAFLVIDQNGMPLLEKSQQGRYALVFLNQVDVMRYRQQMIAARDASQRDYAIAAMPIHRIQRLLSLEKVGICIIQSWEAQAA